MKELSNFRNILLVLKQTKIATEIGRKRSRDISLPIAVAACQNKCRSKCVSKGSIDIKFDLIQKWWGVKDVCYLYNIDQWFLTPQVAYIPTFIEPFVVAKIKCVSWILFYLFVLLKNLLPLNPWNWLTESLGFDRTQVKNHWLRNKIMTISCFLTHYNVLFSCYKHSEYVSHSFYKSIQNV